MKFFVSILLTALLSFVSGLYLPWWGMALVSFGVSALIGQRPWWSALSGFLALSLLWGLLAWMIDTGNNSILSHKIAQIFPLQGSSLLAIGVTALIAGLVGGLAALSGSYMVGRPRVADAD
ncbi:MAG: hypothetical protein P4L51_06815 [Puia sp.]|nr:hypothetical protein [Puia sp.]